MTSYNRVNGTHVCEDPKLLRDVLRDQLGFDGMLISDWGGTYSSADGILASLDIDMPGPTTMRGPCVERDVVSGKLTYEDVDDCVLRVSSWN
jgi:beta-glucosidase